jgi:hypothetical protein
MHGMSCATAPSTRSPSATAPASNARFRRKTSTCSRCNRAMWIRNLLCPQALAGHHGGHLCKRPDLGCAEHTPAGAWNPICQPEPALPRSRSARRQADRADAGDQQGHGQPSCHAGLHLHQPGGGGGFPRPGRGRGAHRAHWNERAPCCRKSTRMRRAAQACSSLLAHVAHLQPIRVAVAHPCDVPSLSAALEARHAGLIEPVLVGPRGAAGSSRHRGRAGSGRRRHCGRHPTATPPRSKPSPWRPQVKSKP